MLLHLPCCGHLYLPYDRIFKASTVAVVPPSHLRLPDSLHRHLPVPAKSSTSTGESSAPVPDHLAAHLPVRLDEATGVLCSCEVYLSGPVLGRSELHRDRKRNQTLLHPGSNGIMVGLGAAPSQRITENCD